MHVVIIGGGIVGCSSAWFLQQAGHQVTVLDSGDSLPNCSHGNAGYVCPSHFIPLATPGIVQQGLRWMLNSESPFYIQPRFNLDLIRWGWHFIRSANEKKVAEAAIPLRDIALYSQSIYEQWASLPAFNFGYEKKGLLEIFQTEAVAKHAADTCEKAVELGLAGTRLLSYDELQQYEPHLKFRALGAIWFPGDAHVYPQLLMDQLKSQLTLAGVRFIREKVTGFHTVAKQLNSVRTAENCYSADAVVLAAGSWSGELATQMDISLPLVAGRGYSLTRSNEDFQLQHPAILTEGRVALTPLQGGKLRIGGTMEIVPTNTPPHFNRMKGVLHAVHDFIPEKEIPFPATNDIWYGYRPCSADGLPYIGRPARWNNLVVATGHAMIGLSLGAGTGKLVADLIDGQPTAIHIQAFHPDRFK
jgi:D-amino-acid dehydrogenase